MLNIVKTIYFQGYNNIIAKEKSTIAYWLPGTLGGISLQLGIIYLITKTL